MICGERFFARGGDTPDNTCQLPRGHAGCHETAVGTATDPNEGGISYAASIRWGLSEPLLVHRFVLQEEAP